MSDPLPCPRHAWFIPEPGTPCTFCADASSSSSAPPLTEDELSETVEDQETPRISIPVATLTRITGLARKALTLESELAQLRRGVVANAGRLSSRTLPRWAHVRDAVGAGSTSARQMCRDAGFDPEELIGREPMEKAGGELRSNGPCPGCGKLSRATTAGCDHCDYEDK